MRRLFKGKLRIVKTALIAGMAIFFIVNASGNTNNLPTTEILGKEYYIYDVKKGESVYGIAKLFNWDLEELLRLNPEAKTELKKGTRLYYPTGQVSVVTEMVQPIAIDSLELEPIRHTVKKGETVYSLARQYNIPVETIYQFNPSAQKGVKAGEVVEIPQDGSLQFYYYTVKPGDNLASIAKQFNTTVDETLKNNPGLTANNLEEGEIIRLTLNSRVLEIKTEMVSEERVSSIKGYKVAKNENWDDISKKTGVEVDVLKEANNNVEVPVQKTTVNVPSIETVEYERTVVANTEPISDDQIEELYVSIKGINPNDSVAEGVRMALILDEPTAKKDIDFTKGLLLAINDFKGKDYKIDLKVMDGRIATADLLDSLEVYHPNMIISTADKSFPAFLADYGNTNNIQIVNVFDLKNDLYEDNASMVQMLPPSSYFNDRIATNIYKNHRDKKLVTLGTEDTSDGIAQELKKLFEDYDQVELANLATYQPEEEESIVFYSYANKKEDIAAVLTAVNDFITQNPTINIKLIGRPSWVTVIDNNTEAFKKLNVEIPTRVWLDENSGDWQAFTQKYNSMFGGQPVRSFPNYSATGYDLTTYFIPVVTRNHGDFNHGLIASTGKGLQNDIDLERVNKWGGFINAIGYILKFEPTGKTKVTVK